MGNQPQVVVLSIAKRSLCKRFKKIKADEPAKLLQSDAGSNQSAKEPLMAKVDITAARLHEILHYDQNTGHLTRIVKSPHGPIGSRLGADCSDGYRQIQIDRKIYKEHRLAWIYMTGDKPPQGFQIDHINGNRADNRWVNLRLVSPSQNQHNRACASKQNRTGLLGVSVTRYGKFLARIRLGEKMIYLGSYGSAELAHDAYLRGKSVLHPTSPRRA